MTINGVTEISYDPAWNLDAKCDKYVLLTESSCPRVSNTFVNVDISEATTNGYANNDLASQGSVMWCI